MERGRRHRARHPLNLLKPRPEGRRTPAQAQHLLADVHEDLSGAVERALDDPEAALFTCTPALDIRSHEQAFLRTRLFQT